MLSTEIAITGLGVVSSLGKSSATIARKLLSGDSGIRKFAFYPGSPEFAVARIASTVKTITADRWPISRATALALAATQAVFPYSGVPLPPEPRLGVIHATAYGNLQSLITYQSDLRRFGMNRASPMQFPNTILHAAASFLSVGIGATAFNITLSSEGLSGADALETAKQLMAAGAADRVLVVTSEDISTELIPLLESSDELDWKMPDPFGEKRSGYSPGEGAVAMLMEPVNKARKSGKRIYGILRGGSGVSHAPRSIASCEKAMRAGLTDANLSPSDIGCVFASANGSRSDGEEANAIAAVFGKQTPVTTVKGALGECGASGSLLSIAAAIYCAEKGYYPATAGRSKYDRTLEPINLLRHKAKVANPVIVVNSFSKSAACSQVWHLSVSRGRA
jgi:3-oxoacyl-[acyl-carrier-protein] synthase II